MFFLQMLTKFTAVLEVYVMEVTVHLCIFSSPISDSFSHFLATGVNRIEAREKDRIHLDLSV